MGREKRREGFLSKRDLKAIIKCENVNLFASSQPSHKRMHYMSIICATLEVESGRIMV
jgi:hypothetical protein